ncbi:histidine phosphatase superfamily [Delphinella strobiligena]|nr:histidine phosphatase superfamily [Delphinella strobiligena]
MAASVFDLLGLGFISSSFASFIPRKTSCDTVQNSYTCDPAVAQNLGEYAPYFALNSTISADVPLGCAVSFVQLLSRHGARYPTSSKVTDYNNTIAKIHKDAKNLTGIYAFLKDYYYDVTADQAGQLTTLGQQELVNSGIKLYERYTGLTRYNTPFVRASGEERVIESAENFTQVTPAYPTVNVIISEATGSNDTLSVSTCNAFENSDTGDDATDTWEDIYTPEISARISAAIGYNISTKDTHYLQDLCAFDTVASPTGEISPFCALFTDEEFAEYNYYGTLDKYYGYGAGNYLGPTQGVGWVNELIARLTTHPVNDHTSTNTTLDTSKTTFPLGQTLYADFSHDDQLTSVFFALGLYNGTPLLSNTTVESLQETDYYSAAWTVPFAARAYFEKLTCLGYEELVRVIVNDRVLPLTSCGSDELGRCRLGDFVDSLSFAKEGGLWDQC